MIEQGIFPDKPKKYIRPKPVSTTHRERYYHFHEPNGENLKSGAVVAGTVFFRLETFPDTDPVWHASLARCVETDNFCKAKGRNASRRRYFQEPDKRLIFGVGVEPSYDLAKEIYFKK